MNKTHNDLEGNTAADFSDINHPVAKSHNFEHAAIMKLNNPHEPSRPLSPCFYTLLIS